ncbi:MAG: GAF domain-containing protein [Hyellaceae cyanobacterium CSU_1_1]|nr:GAF domain-containing protein [Hyellaceae cyanobacterium CSU_1_1]
MTKIPNKNNKAKAEDKLALVETSKISKSVVFEPKTEPETKEQTNSLDENVDQKGGKLIKVETESRHQNSAKSTFQRLKVKTAAALVSSAVMLPILAIGTATYYFGNQAINKQGILAKRSDNIGLTETELARQQKLLAALLIGTGTTALLAGAIAAFGSKRLFDSISKTISKTSESESAEEADTQVYREFINNLSQSVPQKDILKAIVEEARNYLNCDRVVVYSLDQDNYGVIVAESVVLGYTQALGKTIQDACFEARYLDKYRDGRIKAIDDVDKAEMTPCHREQLKQLEVKANLVTPILNEGRLFGLLVAHQCGTSRQWQQGEIEFLHQLAKKAGLALENSKLLGDMVRLQTQAERERTWTHYFTDAIQYIRQSIKQDDVLEISVEEVRRVLECDRVVVYSLNPDNQYGVVIAESVSAAYPRALNKTIEDPCFEARYLDKYRDGRVRAINDLSQAGMTQCYLEQLETLEVKANLVTPILNEGKLFGLLVAHQCSQPREWQDYEIRWVTQIATQVGFALDNAKLLKKLTNDGLPTQLLNNFSLGISERVNRSQLLKIAVEQARKIIKLDRVIVYQFDAHLNGDIVAESVIPGYPRALNSQIKDPCFAREYGAKYRQGRTKAIANIHQANLTNCHLEQLEALSVKASVVVPILQDEQLFGLLIGHQCEQPRLWEQSEIDLFTQLALQLGLALERVELRSELDAVKNVHRKETQKQPLEQHNLEQDISQLLADNQAALQDIRAKISRQSAVTGDFLNQVLAEQQTQAMLNGKLNGNSAPQQQLDYQKMAKEPKNTQIEDDLTAAQKAMPLASPKGLANASFAIADVKQKVEVLNQSHQNLHQW